MLACLVFTVTVAVKVVSEVPLMEFCFLIEDVVASPVLFSLLPFPDLTLLSPPFFIAFRKAPSSLKVYDSALLLVKTAPRATFLSASCFAASFDFRFRMFLCPAPVILRLLLLQSTSILEEEEEEKEDEDNEEEEVVAEVEDDEDDAEEGEGNSLRAGVT